MRHNYRGNFMSEKIPNRVVITKPEAIKLLADRAEAEGRSLANAGARTVIEALGGCPNQSSQDTSAKLKIQRKKNRWNFSTW